MLYQPTWYATRQRTYAAYVSNSCAISLVALYMSIIHLIQGKRSRLGARLAKQTGLVAHVWPPRWKQVVWLSIQARQQQLVQVMRQLTHGRMGQLNWISPISRSTWWLNPQ